eukprot:3651435-Prymnesium_polylepis.1
MGPQLSKYGSQLSKYGKIYGNDMARLSKYGKNVWHIFGDPYHYGIFSATLTTATCSGCGNGRDGCLDFGLRFLAHCSLWGEGVPFISNPVIWKGSAKGFNPQFNP